MGRGDGEAKAGGELKADGEVEAKGESKLEGKAEAKADEKGDAKGDAKGVDEGEAKPGAGGQDDSADSAGESSSEASERQVDRGGAQERVNGDGGDRASPIAQGNVAVAFAESDVERLVPMDPNEDPEARAERVHQARMQHAQEKAHAVARVGAFRDQQGLRIAALTQLPPQINQALVAAEQRGIERVSQAEQAQMQAVRAEVARAAGSAQAAANAARAQIQASYAAATAAINAATTASKTQLTTSHQQSLDATRAAESKQLGEVSRLYGQAEGAFRSAASSAGSHAVSVAAGRASTYRSAKIHRDDSFLDGALTDNRCEARAEAAEKVGQAYREELGKEGDKQAAKMRERKPTDEAAVRQVAEEARRNLEAAHQASLRSLEQSSRQALTNAAKARSGALAGTTRTLQDTLAGLRRHEQAQTSAIQQKAGAQKTGIHQQRMRSSSAFQGAVTKAVADLNGGLAQSIASLRNTEVPEAEALEQVLGDSDQAIAAQLAQFGSGLEQGKVQTVQGLTQSSAAGVQELTMIGQAATASAKQTGSGAAAAIAQGASAAAASMRDMSAMHQRSTSQLATAGARGNTQITTGLNQAYTKLSGNLQEGMQRNADAVRTGLTEVVDRDMGGTITTEANEAASQVQPRWKSVLKWVIIIAIVLVVAIVLGPMVIGAITGLAAGLGASAAVAGTVGAVVGGAIVGAGTAAVTTVVDNAFAGRSGWDLFNGVGTAMAWGALGGALGGGASALLAGPMQGMSAMARYGIQVGVDTVVDTGISALQGNLSWESFGTGVLMSMFVNGVTAHPRVRVTSETAMSRGYGSGFEGGIGLRNRVTGATPPGPTSVPAPKMEHIARGDDVGGGPNAGKWNVRGGGHIPGEIIPRADAEGIPHRTRATDPVTKTSIENFDRWAPSTGTSDKSLFPPGTTRAHVDAMGTEGLNRALSGAPGSSLTPPTPPSTNGTFTAVVQGPNGHPIEISGYYTPTASGGFEVQTVFPNSNPHAGTIPVVGGTGLGGSRTLPIPSYSHATDRDPEDREEGRR